MLDVALGCLIDLRWVIGSSLSTGCGKLAAWPRHQRAFSFGVRVGTVVGQLRFGCDESIRRCQVVINEPGPWCGHSTCVIKSTAVKPQFPDPKLPCNPIPR